MKTKNLVAFDCSNSSIRTILGKYDGRKIELELIAQVSNDMVHANGIEYWDILRIYQNIIDGLRKAAGSVDRIDSIGICSWGVDFALYHDQGWMLGNPLSYRNPFGQEILEEYSDQERKMLFKESGILCDKINSIYMLQAVRRRVPEVMAAADKLLMIPDILNYMLTGVMCNEPSELSTTQLFDVSQGKISETICAAADISPKLFSSIGTHGTLIGRLTPEIVRQIGIEYEIPVICVPSHDTAAAVLAAPAEENDFLFLSSGTWSLIGSEVETPIINDGVRAAGFTNEFGAFGKITFLKNSMGMFLVQRLKQELDSDLEWEEFYQLSDEYESEEVPHFDVNDPRFFNPESMSDEIWKALLETGELNDEREKNFGLMIRSFLESMACNYRDTVNEIEKVREICFHKIYVFGGGVRNQRLNQLMAEYTGKQIVAGSDESTSCGNLLTQIKYFEPELTIADLRKIMRNSLNI